MESNFRDHFSSAAAEYAAHRPTYPPEFAQFLAGVAPRAGTAWDCGCGSGQLSVLLAEHFEHVIATDASRLQLSQATPHPRVEYRVARAEASGLPDASVDLAVAAQAAHWFELDEYYAEVRRVLVPGGVIALASYGVARLDPDIHAAMHPFYADTLKKHWPPERWHVDDEYRSIAFPFPELPAPKLELRVVWTLDQMLGYISTWSAVLALVKSGGGNEWKQFESTFTRAWGPPSTPRTIRWPLAIRVGRVGAKSSGE
jgi:SAM-dependent methyltransferase